MRKQGSLVVVAIIGAVAGVLLAAAVQRTSGQNQADTLARMADGRPNLNGIWQVMNTANWNLEDHPAQAGDPRHGAIGAIPPGLGVVEGGPIPYQPAAAQKRAENFKNRRTEDPEAKCYLPGVPRAMYMPYPFYGFAEANRTIHMDKAKPEPAPIDSWMGRSHGRWEGDTLVVDAAGFNGQAWFDRAGNFASDAMKIVERYTPAGANLIMYEATIEDPTVFTRPWRISMPIVRRPETNAQVLEFKCVEFAEELLYGHLRRQDQR